MIEALIDKLINLNIQIGLVDGDRLKINTDINKIPNELLAELKLKKNELISYLKEQHSNNQFGEIPTVKEADSYVLTSAQRSIWLVSQFEEANIAYNMPTAMVFTGELNYESLSFAFDVLIERYESLRTVFREHSQGDVRQFILSPEEYAFHIGYEDLRLMEERHEYAKEIIKKESTRPFDLSNGPLIRADVFQITDDSWLFTLVLHHIISDGWSMDILLNELLSLYNAHAQGQTYSLKPLRIQYKDYAAWQQEQLAGEAIQEHRNYWLKQFEGPLPVLELPADKERPAIKTYNGDKWTRLIDLKLGNDFKKLATDNGATLFMGLLALVNTVLYRYTRQEDIIIGTPIAGRLHADTLDQVGYFINTLALRNRFKGENSFVDLLSTTKRVTLDAYSHQLYPFDELITELNLQRDISRNPLFDVQVVLHNSAVSNNRQQQYFHNLQVRDFEEVVYSTSVFFMVFSFTETTEGIRLDIMYNCDIYSEAMMDRLSHHLECILAAIIKDPHKPVSQLSFLDEKDLNKLLHEFNDNAIAYDRNITVIDLISQQASSHPQQIAVVSGDKKLTYKELDEQSGKLAAYLKENYKAGPGTLAGVLLYRSEKMVIAILGILKAGAAYVPVDPDYPAARKEFIMKDAGIKLLITQTDHVLDLAYFEGGIFAIDVQLNEIDAMQPVNVKLKAEDIAYVIYTSGSTGQPKGVMVHHAAFANSIRAQQEIFDLQPGDRSMQFFSFSFDASVFEIFIALTSGAALCIIGDEDKKDPLLLEQYINDQAIDIAILPAAYLQLIDIKKIPAVKKLMTGGESVLAAKAVSFTEQGVYFNAYGPTESAICVCMFRLDKEKKINSRILPIGRPIANTQVYILDEYLYPAPIGVTGEICIGGAQLAKGYLNNPELTAQKFIPNPFKQGEKLYRTGDLGRWLADGNVEFIGRKDDQFKVRGHRVELGEIQAALQMHKDIDSCVVIADTANDGETELIAYIVSRQVFTAADIRNYLSDLVPAYMLPHQYVQLDALPLTTNSKLDKEKLLALKESQMAAGVDYVAPRTEVEMKIASIWQEALGKETIGIKDDYFELGGSSLKAMGIIKRMIDEIGISIPIKLLFEEKTIERIAAHVADHKNVQPTLNITAEEDEAPLSYNQQIYFADWKYGNDVVVADYAMEQLDVAAFRLSVQQLIERHETLRTIFIKKDGTIKQKILPAAAVNFEVKGPVAVPSEDEMHRIIVHERSRKFSMDLFPPIFAGIFKVTNGDYHILFTMHHIITDGYSGGVLINDLFNLYTANTQPKELPAPLPFQYRHFVAWQQNFLATPEGANHKSYWHKRLGGATLLNFGPDEGSAATDDYAISFTKLIDENIFETIDLFCRHNSLTRTSLLLGILNLTVHQLTGEKDITILSTVSGRNSRYYGGLDVSGLMGFFANSLPVRNIIDTKTTIVDYLRQVQSNFLDDLNYQDYPFAKLVAELPGLSPAMFLDNSVFYNYHNYEYKRMKDYEAAGYEKDGRAGTTEAMQSAMGVAVTEYRNCLHLQFLFNPHLFKPSAVLGVVALYSSILHHTLSNPGSPVSVLSEKDYALA